MSFPYLDLLGVQRRSFLRPKYFEDVEAQSPGFTVQSIASQSSSINSRLRKRYGNALPFGQGAPPLIPSGLTPPQVTLTGRPTLGSYLTVLQVTTGGTLGTAVFRWSADGGITWTSSVATAATVLLGSTGMTANFPALNAMGGPAVYDTSNAYAAAPPVPEIILKWVTTLVTADVFRRHGVNPNDPMMLGLVEEVKQVRLEIEEAANSQTGLFDLPTNEDEASAIDTGGPLGFSDTSPYRWMDRQQALGSRQDAEGLGGCGPFPPNTSWVPPR
jgi:hypothetical protein